MKRTLLSLLLILSLLLLLPITAQAVEVAYDSECLAFQSGYHPHDWRWQSEEAANCIHGKITHYKCRNCNNTTTVTDSALGPHDYRDDWYVTQPATCTAPGEQVRYCHVCQQQQTSTIAAMGHQWDGGTVTKAATCTEAGVRTYTCQRMNMDGAVCGATRTEAIPATGHSWDSGKVTTQPTCTAAGVRTYTCTRCKATRTESIPATGHAWGAWETVTAGDCVTPGQQRRVCQHDASHVETQSIPASGSHTWGEWQVEYPGTCVQQGMNVRTCTRCGKQEYVYSGYGDHDWGPWTVVTEPTATTPGQERRVCKNTPNHVETREIPATGAAEEPKPAIQLEVTWDEDAGVGKRYEGAIIPFYIKLTNIGNCPVYDAIWPPDEDFFDYVYPGETVYIPEMTGFYTGNFAVINPGESWAYTSMYWPVKASDVESGVYTGQYEDSAHYLDTDGEYQVVWSNYAPMNVPLTYPEGGDPKDAGKYVLLGLREDFTGCYPVGGGTAYALEEDPASLLYFWSAAPAEDEPNCAFSRLFANAGETVSVTEAPVPGQAYYFHITLTNPQANDHTIDFGQIDPAQVQVSLAGFSVELLAIRQGNPANTGGHDCVHLYFKATCGGTTGTPEEAKPGLKLEMGLLADEYILDMGVLVSGQEAAVLTLPEQIFLDYFDVTNTGNVPLNYKFVITTGDHAEKHYSGELRLMFWGTLDPGHVYYGNTLEYHYDVDEAHVIPDPEDSPYAGTYTETWKVVGYALDDTEYTTPICESNAVTFEFKIAKDEGTAADEVKYVLKGYTAHVPVLSATDSDGITKVYGDYADVEKAIWEGAEPPLLDSPSEDVGYKLSWWPGLYFFTDPEMTEYRQTDSKAGDVYYTSGSIQNTKPFDHSIDFSQVDPSLINVTIDRFNVELLSVEPQVIRRSESREYDMAYMKFKVTYLGDGATGAPEEAKPALNITWMFDRVYPNPGIDTGMYETTEDKLYEPHLWVLAEFDILNAGNVPLDVKVYFSLGNGLTSETNWPGGRDEYTFKPGESQLSGWGFCPLSDFLTPGTETAELLGTVDITMWAKGFDLKTGKELCTSNEITRSWKVRKPGTGTPEPDPGKSKLTVSLEDGKYNSDPAGYQLGEKCFACIYVSNEGSVAVDNYTIHVDYVAANKLTCHSPDSEGPDWYEVYFDLGQPFHVGNTAMLGASSPRGYISEDDVARGYVQVSVYVTWTDPGTGTKRQSNTATITLPVISKTGLLLKKDIAHGPDNGSYFEAGEEIPWTLTVTNNSKEPITDVVVTDQGIVVGSFAEIKPGETLECAVPGHVVTKYEALVVGSVSNIATATGKDIGGVSHTWPSNPISVPTSSWSPVPLPHTDEDDPGPTPPDVHEDPLGPVHGVHVKTSLWKATAHEPVHEGWYGEGEPVDYTVTIKNTGDTALDNIRVYDSLHGLTPVETIPSLAPGEEKSVAFQYIVTKDDVDVWGYVVNQVTIWYDFLGIPGTPQMSNKVYVVAGENGHLPDDRFDDKDGGDPSLQGDGGDACALKITALGDSEIHYTLHHCESHTEAARKAEGAAPDEAAAIWREAVNQLYEALYARASAEAQAAVMNDQIMFGAYADAYGALFGDERLAEMLRLWCAELCCMLHTVPDALPGSLLGDYPTLMMMMALGDNETSRVFGVLNGSDCDVTIQLDESLADVLQQTMDTVFGTKLYATDASFAKALKIWQIALDNTVNNSYKAADRDGKTLIAAWRQGLDQLYTTRRELLVYLYPGNPETVQECLMNLYRDAAIDARIAK